MSTLFDKEPMVKIPQKDFEKLIYRYKTAGTFKRLYNEAEEKITALQGSVGRLIQQVNDLTLKVHQLTNFIKGRGLLEAFHDFIAPKKHAITTELKERKQQAAKRSEIGLEVMTDKTQSSKVKP